MKIALYILGGIVAVLSLLFVGFLWIASGANLPSIPPRKMDVPDGFDASLYQDISNLRSVEGIEVTDLSQYGTFFDVNFLPNDGLVWIMSFDGEDGLVYQTVNRAGEVTGLQRLPRRPSVADTYLLSDDGYYEMSAAGFSAFTPYQEITGEITEARLIKLNRESSYYRRSSWTDAPRDSVAFRDRLSQHIMRHDGVWKTLTTGLETQLEFRGGTFNSLPTQSINWGERPGRQNDAFPTERFDLQMTYFDQKEFFTKMTPSMGSTTGMGRPAHWRGTGYYTLTLGEHVIWFFIENDTMNVASSGFIYLTAESHEDLGFMLLKHQDTSNKYRAFIIRPSAP